LIEHLFELIVLINARDRCETLHKMAAKASFPKTSRRDLPHQRRRAMTTMAKLLAQRQQLVERLAAEPGPHERDEIERLLEEIDAALQSLDEAGPGISRSNE
jgi:hypothetical protein